MKKTIVLLTVLAMMLALLAGCAPSAPASTELGSSQRVVILVLDALSSAYLNELGSNSNLAKIAKDGAARLDAQCVYPSHTLTNHATIMTGVSAGVHGIVGNVRLAEGSLSTTIKSKEPEMLNSTTIFELAKAQGLKTAVVSGKNNLVTLFSKDCDVGTSNVNRLDYLGDAPDLSEAEDDNQAYYEMNLELADWVFESLYTVLEREEPNLTLVNVQSADYVGHRFGPDSKELKTAVERIDKALGKMYNKMKKSGMLENTTLIIVADHGMTVTDTENDKSGINLNVLTMMNFPEAGAAIDGRTGYIWLNGTDKQSVIDFFSNVEGVAEIIERGSDRAKELSVDSVDGPDLILNTEAGYIFLPQPMVEQYHGQHGSLDESDMTIPMIMVGAGIPAGAGIEMTDLRSIAPLVCQLLGISGGSFEISVPTLLPQQDLTKFKK